MKMKQATWDKHPVGTTFWWESGSWVELVIKISNTEILTLIDLNEDYICFVGDIYKVEKELPFLREAHEDMQRFL